MSEIIDRRANGRRKSAGNQQRFLKRYKAQIREAVARAVAQRKIADTDRGGNVTIPSRDLSEPSFSIGPGGVRQRVLPGNKEFTTGDRIPARRAAGAGRARARRATRARARTPSPSRSRARSSSSFSSRTWSCPTW